MDLCTGKRVTFKLNGERFAGVVVDVAAPKGLVWVKCDDGVVRAAFTSDLEADRDGT